MSQTGSMANRCQMPDPTLTTETIDTPFIKSAESAKGDIEGFLIRGRAAQNGVRLILERHPNFPPIAADTTRLKQNAESPI
jgi:hypothetical protein